MQCVSYNQMCYQAVNTKVIGLFVLISVFISVILYRDFFFPVTSRSRPLAWSKEVVLQGLCRDSHIVPLCLPPPALSVAEQLSTHGCHHAAMPMRMRRPRRALTAWLKSAPWRFALQFLLVWRSKRIPCGQGEGKDTERGQPFTLGPV